MTFSSILRRRSMQVTKSLTHSVGGYLPNTLTEMWEPSRDFAFLRLPTSGTRCVVALSGYGSLPLSPYLIVCIDDEFLRTMPHVMVVSSEGYFYLYSIDLENGGECSLIKQYRWVYLLYCVFFLRLLMVYLAWLNRRKRRRG